MYINYFYWPQWGNSKESTRGLDYVWFCNIPIPTKKSNLERPGGKHTRMRTYIHKSAAWYTWIEQSTICYQMKHARLKPIELKQGAESHKLEFIE